VGVQVAHRVIERVLLVKARIEAAFGEDFPELLRAPEPLAVHHLHPHWRRFELPVDLISSHIIDFIRRERT
jgi:hypothetical protein